MAREKTEAKKPTTKRNYAAALRDFSERLDHVAWEQLEHAYGKANDVPTLLRALATGNRDDQEEILFELYSNVLHQGTVYGASPHAVPFVIELLDIGKGWRLRAELLEYLGHLARGTSTDPVIQRKTRRAVAQGIESYSRFLDGGRTEVRRAAVFVLGGLVARPPVVRILWRALSTSRNVGVRACVALALGAATTLKKQNAKVLTDVLADAPLVRIAAAMSLTGLLGAASPASAVGTLLGSLPPVEKTSSDFDALPPFWPDIGLVACVCECLGRVGPGSAPRLIEALSSLEGLDAVHAAYTLAEIAYKPEKSLGREEVAQRDAVLAAIVASTPTWGSRSPLELLQQYGYGASALSQRLAPALEAKKAAKKKAAKKKAAKKKAAKKKAAKKKAPRFYKLLSYGNRELFAGRIRDKRLVLMGMFCPDILTLFFEANGSLSGRESRACDPPPAGKGNPKSPYRYTPQFVAGFERQVEEWKAELGFVESPILVREFHDKQSGVRILPVPEHLLDLSWAEDEEERQEAEEGRRHWEAEGSFVFRWADDYWMNRDGEIEST